MKKDIDIPPVEDIAIAIVKEDNELSQAEWNVYMLNMKNETIEGVLVSSRGYGELNGENKKTATFRHFLDTIAPHNFSKVEMITEELFALSNEFWVSFYINKVMYDKKYIFLAESICEENFIMIPIINKRGVMIK